MILVIVMACGLVLPGCRMSVMHDRHGLRLKLYKSPHGGLTADPKQASLFQALNVRHYRPGRARGLVPRAADLGECTNG